MDRASLLVRLGIICASFGLHAPAALQAAGAPQRGQQPAMSAPAVTYRTVTFAELPGWDRDDHAAALQAFMKSCGQVLAATKAGTLTARTLTAPEVLSACYEAGQLLGRKPDSRAARSFFETHFAPHRVVHTGEDGLLTGYYEPLFEASRRKHGAFQVPVYRRPPDLVTLIGETQATAGAQTPTHAQQTAAGVQSYPTRAEIETGALAGRGLELVYMRDSVDLFFMQVQGSGRIKLDDGSLIRVSYDGKNGHPYTSIGRHLIDNNLLAADRVSLDGLARWLRADPERGRQVMQQNASYVFFRELKGKTASSALGVLEIPLTPGRSLAIDAGFHALGMPVFVSAPTLTHVERGNGFHRLMIAQDVGGAIKGPERGDIYFGSGTAAGKLAGVTRHPGNLYLLLPARLEVPKSGVQRAGP